MRPLWIACLLSAAASAQPRPLSFEAAEIKINNSGANDSHGDIVNGRLIIRNITLRYLIAEAWTIQQARVSGPSWLDEIRVDVVAKAASPAIPDKDVREMMQTLLKERMKLVSHMDDRETTVWALTVWKGQHKLKPAEMPQKPEDTSCELNRGNSGTHLACQRLTMAGLVHKLPQVAYGDVNMTVVDQTGLDGAWDITLDWMPEARAQTEGGTTLFAALQAQAGLQLATKKVAVPVLVVDSLERAPVDQ